MLSTRWCALVALVLLAMAAAATATVTGTQMSAAEGDALAAEAQHSESPLAAHAVEALLDAVAAADGEDGEFAALAELESESESEAQAPAKTAKKAKAKAKAPAKANKAKKAKATPAKAKAAKAKAAKPAKVTKAKTAKATKTKAAKSTKSTKTAKAKTTKAAKSTKAAKTTKAAKSTKSASAKSAKSTKTTAAKSTKTAKASKSSKAAKTATGAKAAKATTKATTKSTKASKLSADTKKAAKKTNPKLSAAENAAKYTRYRKLHPRRVRNAKAELAVFSANRARIVALNAKLGTSKRPTPFRSVGPFANLSPKDFKKKFLNAKHPRNRKNKRAVPAPATKAVKGGKAPVRKAAKTVVKATTKAATKAKTATTKAKAKTTTAAAKVSSLKKRATTTKKASSSKKKSFLEVHADEEYQSLLESAAENGVDAAALARAELAAEAFAEAWESAEMGSWVQVQLEADAEADAQAPTLPTTTRSSGAGRKVGNGKDVGKGGTRGGNGQDVGKGGTRGGNGQDVGKGGTRGGNGQDVGKGGTRGGNGQEVGKGGTRGGNGEDVGKGGTRGGNGEDVTKGGTRGGNGDDVTKGGTRGGDGDDLIVNDFDGVEALPADFVPRPTTRAQVVASLTKAGASQAQLDFVFHNTKEIGMIRSGKVVDQGTCGSCWAQTASNTIAMQRGRYFQGLARVVPSVQQLLDCVQTKESGGCAGGTPMDALEWMSTNRVSPAHDYPMREDGESGTCRIAPGGVDDEFRSWGWQPAVPVCEDSNPNCNNQQLQEIALLDQLMQAVSIPIAYVDATNWQMYDGGILDTQLCSSTLEAGNHVVELTGVASDPVTGVPYWFLRNSWGEKWGEKGLIRVPFGVNACGLANWVVVPIPPPFIQGRTQEETRAKAASTSMGIDPRQIMPANEQFPMPDKNAAINKPTRPVSTVVPSRDAGIIVDSSSGIKFNSLNGMWFDPSKGGWTTDRPAAAPANMGPGSAAATASKDAATAVHTTPSPQEADALKAGVLYDSARDLWFDPKMGKWTQVIPLNVPDSFRYLKISTQMRTEPTPAEAIALKAGCRKDGSMWMDPDIGGWTATRPRQCPASLEFLKH